MQTDFYLCNSNGEEINRKPARSDYIKINLAGPGTGAGAGFDWVRIEEIIERENDNQNEFTSMRVRPAACPITREKDTAHFFKDEATTTFIVSRSESAVTAEVHGRNEVPNKDTSHTADNIRNTMVAKIATIKLSDIQWKNLCKGLLD